MTMAMAVFLSVAVVSLAGCGGGGGTPERAASPAASPAATPIAPGAGAGAVIGASPGGPATSAAKQHDIRGRIEAISHERGRVTIDHEEIPGVMEAMEMEYVAADPAILNRLGVGDRVEGRIEERGDGYVLVALRKR